MCFTKQVSRKRKRRNTCISKPLNDAWSGSDDNIGFKTKYIKINKRNDRRIHPETRKPNTSKR